VHAPNPIAQVDRLDNVGAVRTEISEHITSSSPSSSSSSSGGRVRGPANDVVLMEMNPSGHSICRFLNESERVGALRDNLTIAAYVIPRSETSDSKLVMLQRRITYRVNRDGDTDTPSGPTPGPGPSPSLSLCVELKGFPMLIPYSSKWSCARVRVTLWQQLSRFIKEEEKERDTPLGALLKAACLQGEHRYSAVRAVQGRAGYDGIVECSIVQYSAWQCSAG
jgi:hypothetical protein